MDIVKKISKATLCQLEHRSQHSVEKNVSSRKMSLHSENRKTLKDRKNIFGTYKVPTLGIRLKFERCKKVKVGRSCKRQKKQKYKQKEQKSGS